jgi:hypothetical protein
MGIPVTTLQVQNPLPLGEVTLLPRAATGRPEIEMARAMAAALGPVEAESPSEALKALRQAFPHAPLNVRVAALDEMIERRRRQFDS